MPYANDVIINALMKISVYESLGNCVVILYKEGDGFSALCSFKFLKYPIDPDNINEFEIFPHDTFEIVDNTQKETIKLKIIYAGGKDFHIVEIHRNRTIWFGPNVPADRYAQMKSKGGK